MKHKLSQKKKYKPPYSVFPSFPDLLPILLLRHSSTFFDQEDRLWFDAHGAMLERWRHLFSQPENKEPSGYICDVRCWSYITFHSPINLHSQFSKLLTILQTTSNFLNYLSWNLQFRSRFQIFYNLRSVYWFFGIHLKCHLLSEISSILLGRICFYSGSYSSGAIFLWVTFLALIKLY